MESFRFLPFLYFSGGFWRDNFSLELVKNQHIEEVNLLHKKIEILENNYEKQSIALEEEKKKTTNFMVNMKHYIY